MASTTPYEQTKALETHIGTIIAATDVDSLPNTARELLSHIKRLIVDARLDIRDYDYADTRAEQSQRAKQAQTRLINVQKMILSASEYNIFSAADVAQLSAAAEHITAQLT